MKKIKEPNIKFTYWTKWSKRNLLPEVEFPGVYILARFDRVPKGRANTKAKQIIYIGETCDKTLKERWYQFNRSAFNNKPGHSGGETYFLEYGDNGYNLYVAAFPLSDEFPDSDVIRDRKLAKEIRSLFIRYVERKLIWNYAKKWG